MANNSSDGDHAEPPSTSKESLTDRRNDIGRATRLKIYLHLMPTITVIYILSFLDRINIGNALLFGLPQDLQLRGSQVNVSLSIFFVSYVIFEIPATILMKRITPRIFLPVSMLLFGLLTMVQGFARNYGTLVAIRFLLGVAEAGVYPGCFYLMSMWYTRNEAQKRFTFFFSGASFAGSFGGLLASAIGHMRGAGGYAAWRWIFILEGILTCVVALIAFFTISPFPEDGSWLDQEEKEHVIERLRNEQGASGFEQNITATNIVHALSDWTILLSAPLYFSLAVSAYGMAFFIPTIVATYGYTPIQAQLHSAAPWAAALGFSLIVSYASDRFQRRFVFILLCLVPAFMGNIMLLAIHENRAAEYGAVVLYLMGVIGAVPMVVCWYTMNLQGHQERAVGIPWQVGFGNAAGIVSTFAFPATDSPRYELGYALGLGFLCLATLIATAYFLRCYILNRRLGYAKFTL